MSGTNPLPRIKKNLYPQNSPLDETNHEIQNTLNQTETDYQTGKYELALPVAFDLLKQDQHTSIQAGLIISLIYRELGCIPHSIQFVQKAFAWIEKGDASLSVARAYQLIANIFDLIMDTQQTFIYLSKGLEIYHYLNYTPGLAECYALLAEINLENQEFQQTKFYVDRSLSYSNRAVFKRQQASGLNTLGAYYLQIDQIGNASRKLYEALALAKEIQSPFEQARSFYHLAVLAKKQQEIHSALDFADSALNFSQKIKSIPLQKKCHRLFADIFKERNEFEKAFYHLEACQVINQDIDRNSLVNQLRAIEINYKIELYSQKNQQLRLEIHKRTKDQAELEYLATTDPLTGLYNRRYFFTLAEHICEQAQKTDKKLCALMMDIDHFKLINDENGHPFGDKVLVAISTVIQKNLREDDILCRFGGEEFCALLPNTDIKHAFLVAERIRKNIDSQEFTIDNQVFPITISLGVADLKHSPKNSLMGLIGYADQALYKAKHKGRNQVALFNNNYHDKR